MNDEESPPPRPEATEIPSDSLLVRISAAQFGQNPGLMAYHWKTFIETCSFTLVDEANGLRLRPAVKVRQKNETRLFPDL